MAKYKTEQIRNVALLGHGGSGKTTLTEALLLKTGVIGRLGRVEDGSTVSDWDPEEHRRGISINLAVIPIEYDRLPRSISSMHPVTRISWVKSSARCMPPRLVSSWSTPSPAARLAPNWHMTACENSTNPA